jgi:hypothetical protein
MRVEMSTIRNKIYPSASETGHYRTEVKAEASVDSEVASDLLSEGVRVYVSNEGILRMLKIKKLEGLEMTEQEMENRRMKELAFQTEIKPLIGTHKMLSSKDIKPFSDWPQVISQQDPKLYEKIKDVFSRIGNGEHGADTAKEVTDLFKQANSVYEAFKRGEGNPVMIDYELSLGDRAADYRVDRGQDVSYTINMRAEDLTRAYADIYDEIVESYRNGTRKSYAFDMASKTGYRLMNVEEELAELDKAFDKKAESINTLVQRDAEITEALRKYGEQLERAGCLINAKEIHKAYEERLKAKEDIPLDLADRMKYVKK